MRESLHTSLSSVHTSPHRNRDGTPFDFDSTYEGILDVRCTPDRPGDAAIAIEHEGHWYSIARNDMRSKQTFVLLGQMVQMQSSSYAPVPSLTISGD